MNLRFSKCGWKINLFCDNRALITYCLKKRIKNSRFWSTQISENVLLLSISRNSLYIPSLEGILLGNFAWSSSIILVEDPVKWKTCFEILLIDHFAGDIRNKISLVIIKKFLYQCHPPYSSISSHRVLHLQFLGSCNIHIIYLQVKAACLKVNFTMFYFCHSKNSSNIMSDIFNFLSM